MGAEQAFQRARSADQVQARRAAITNVARELLDSAPVADVSLREVARRVGLSKSNVVRYFPTREAIFLTLLIEDYAAALDSLEVLLAPPGTSHIGGEPDADGGTDAADPALHLAQAIANTFTARPRLCELLSTSQAVLERNVPTAEAETFKRAMLTQLHRLAALIADQLPQLTPIAAFEAAGISWLVIAGTWPLARPTPAVAAALDNPELAILRVDFTTLVSRTLHATLTGLRRLPPPAAQQQQPRKEQVLPRRR